MRRRTGPRTVEGHELPCNVRPSPLLTVNTDQEASAPSATARKRSMRFTPGRLYGCPTVTLPVHRMLRADDPTDAIAMQRDRLISRVMNAAALGRRHNHGVFGDGAARTTRGSAAKPARQQRVPPSPPVVEGCGGLH